MTKKINGAILDQMREHYVETSRKNALHTRTLGEQNHSCKTCSHFASGLHFSSCLFKMKKVEHYNLCHLHLCKQQESKESKESIS